MSQNSGLENQNTKSSFGTGFALGMIFGAATIFFLATKTGRELLKKMNLADFEKFTKLFESQDFEADNGEIFSGYDEDKISARPPVLGRRFFRRKF